MKSVWRGLMLVALALVLLFGGREVVLAQTPTTTVQDTVYSANGTPAQGAVVVTWGAFTTAGGEAVPAGSTTATIGSDGVLTLALAPNAGSTPMGSYYTAVFHLSDGTTSKEYWVVPVTVPGGGPAKLAAIRNQVLPTMVAMQTVSKQYVDNAIAQAQIGAVPLDSSPYVMKAGDSMTGPLVLPGDPATPQQAADKHYVDTNISSVTAGLAGKVSLLPSATQVVSQPAGTQLEVNRLNGSLFATPLYIYGTSGVQTALNSSDCTNGCRVVVDPTYPGKETLFTTLPSRTSLWDERSGALHVTANNPLDRTNADLAETIEEETSDSATSVAAAAPGTSLGAASLVLAENALAGGNNQYPAGVESVPYFKSTYGALSTTGRYYTEGQHIQSNNEIDCYAVGDCLAGSQQINSVGGVRDPADEGTHPYDLVVREDTRVFRGTCNSGCTAGSTSVMISATADGGTQGEGRYLIDKNPAGVISVGSLVGGAAGQPFATALFSGTSFPVSVFLETAAAATSQPTNMAPGTVTLPITTTGVPTGFASNTAALPASSGVACVADPQYQAAFAFPNFETAAYTVVDGTHIQLTLNKVHVSGAVIAVGGLCGYGLEQTADTSGVFRQVFPVVGSINGTSLYYADGGNPVIGRSTSGTTSAYANLSLSIAAISRTGNVVTVTTAAPLPRDVNGLGLTVSGVADSSYNGTFAVTTTSRNTLTYADTGADSTSSGGTVGLLTGGYALYPMAEVLSVYNPVTQSVDGTMTLAANTVSWSVGDAVEEPHFYLMNVHPDYEDITQVIPRPAAQYLNPGKNFYGEVGPGVNGWTINNNVPASVYYGGGGTHELPDSAYRVTGAWTSDMDVTAGASSVLDVHCNLHGCGRWDSGYDLFQLDAQNGQDRLNYSPASDTATWYLGNATYTMTPSGFSANTINVGTLNATTLNANVPASSITSGVLNAARLPVFGPSGTTHAVGAVPDPGATAGATRFLREDGTWAVPSGSGSGSSSGAAGGDLSGSYPNPTVSAVHATGGTLDGVTIGATTPTAASFSQITVGDTSIWGAGNTTGCNLCTYWANGGAQLFGQGQTYGQITEVSSDQSSSTDSFALYLGKVPNSSGTATNSDLMWQAGIGSMAQATFFGWSSSSAGAGTSASALSLRAGFSNPAAGVVSCDTSTAGNAGCTLKAGQVVAPALASGTAANSDVAGMLTLNAGSTSSASYTFAKTYATAPVCMVQPQSAMASSVAALNGFSAQVSATGLSVSVGTAPGAAVTFGYVCVGRS